MKVHIEQQQQNDAKTHYTNLEPAVAPQNYYIEGYQPAGSFAYLPPGTNKDYPVFHSPSPNTVLYKG